ncbi:MAG: DEAD/DEAH box helicase, partial [Elusimicrobiota bacterium]
MAAAVYNAVIEKKHLIVEAGTGVGKSLAYLLPSALWAVQNTKKIVVATYTKALQEQLTKKDLPIV